MHSYLVHGIVRWKMQLDHASLFNGMARYDEKSEKCFLNIHGMTMRIPYLEWRGDLDFDPTLRGKA